jgi:hypothetical protein
LEVCHKEEKWCGEGSETGRVFKGETPYFFPPVLSERYLFIYRFKILVYFRQGVKVVLVTC